jgi:2-polyprenyl-3-methyl-5-hydroxy-6-metoxy-1,4-benzoquinol methylase
MSLSSEYYQVMQRPWAPQSSKMDNLEIPNEIPVDDSYPDYTESTEFDECSAFSVASTKHNLHYENGRLYYDYRSNNPFPTDEIARENEQVLHLMVLYLLEDKLVGAPVDPKTFKTVLDLGSGMGLWAEDMADRYSDCQVYAVDMQYQIPSVMPNCHFLQVHVDKPWIFDNTHTAPSFDFIHIRSLFASLAPDAWPPLYEQCFQ